SVCCCLMYFFFFQAEDGIRDFHVTGVQTCALPIFGTRSARTGWPSRPASGTTFMRRYSPLLPPTASERAAHSGPNVGVPHSTQRSEERRVGKECRSRWSRHASKNENWRVVMDDSRW